MLQILENGTVNIIIPTAGLEEAKYYKNAIMQMLESVDMEQLSIHKGDSPLCFISRILGHMDFDNDKLAEIDSYFKAKKGGRHA